MPKTVVIFGASGALGQMVVDHLCQQNHTVISMPRSLDVLDAASMTEAAQQFNDGEAVVINLVTAYPLFSSARAEKWAHHRELLTTGVDNMLRFAEAINAQHFIQLSSTTVYGATERVAANEQSPVNPPSLLRDWLAAEERVTASTIPYTILRCGLLVGEGAPHFSALLDFAHKQRLPVLGNGDTQLSIVSMQDVATAYGQVVADARKQSRVFNICYDALSFYDLAQQVMQHVGATGKPRKVPKFVARAAVDRDVYEVATMSAVVSSQQARDKLGWRPSVWLK